MNQQDIHTQIAFNEPIDVFSDTLKSAACESEALDALFDFMRSLDLTKLTYTHIPSHQPDDLNLKHFYARGYPPSKVDEYKRRHKLSKNRITEYVRMDSDPRTLLEAFKFLNYSQEQKSFLAEFYMSDHTTGLVIPVFGINNRKGSFILTAIDEDRTHSAQELRVIRWACMVCHNKFCKILVDKDRDLVSLTDREMEVLTWVARGKSNSVIADIMGISPHTVNGYLRSVYLKTGVSDRTSAALVGVRDALISI